MIAALVIVGVLGIGLPAGLFFVSRWRSSKPFKAVYREHGYKDDISRWLSSEFQLNWSQRDRVRKIVLHGDGMNPALAGPAQALAARVLADQVRSLRQTRRTGQVQMVVGVVAAVFAVVVFAGGWSWLGNSAGQAAIWGVLWSVIGCSNGIVLPRRIRRNAERVLAAADSQPTASE